MDTIYEHIKSIHNKIKKVMPDFTGIDFGTISSGRVYGYLHTEEKVYSFNSIAELKALVMPYRKAPRTFFKEIDGFEYAYQVDPEDGSIDLEGGLPVDEMEVVAVKAECLADYEARVEAGKTEAAENKALDMELRGKRI